VGIYHETYKINIGNYESIYGNMPLYGLGKALKLIPVTKRQNSAHKRLNSTEVNKTKTLTTTPNL